MPSVAHAATVLAAPRRAAEALRVSSEHRLDDLAAAEQRIRARERDVDLREQVLRRAIDAGASRGNDAKLHRWVVDELLPELSLPEASVCITAEMERRAAELDEHMLALEERELQLREVAEELTVRGAEIAMREREVERRLRQAATTVSEAEEAARRELLAARRWMESSSRGAIVGLASEESGARAEVMATRVAELSHLRVALLDLPLTRGVATSDRGRPDHACSSPGAKFKRVVESIVFLNRSKKNSEVPTQQSRGLQCNIQAPVVREAPRTEPIAVERSLLSEPAFVRLDVGGDSCDPAEEDAVASGWEDVRKALAAADARGAELDQRAAEVEGAEREAAELLSYVKAQREACDRLASSIALAAPAKRRPPPRSGDSSQTLPGSGIPLDAPPSAYTSHPLLAFAHSPQRPHH